MRRMDEVKFVEAVAAEAAAVAVPKRKSKKAKIELLPSIV